MSKFGFNNDDYRQPAAPAQDTQVTKLIEHAVIGTGVLDTPLDYALRYAALGWHVLPVRADKKPLEGYGLNSATADPHTIKLIWTAHPEANIAVACEASGLVVMDIDPRNAGDKTVEQLEAEHGPLRSAVTATTQGGGQHRFFKAEPHTQYPGTLGAGVDLKHRGYVLVEPSQGLQGVYKWVEDKDPTQGSTPDEAPRIFRPRPPSSDLAVTIKPGSVIVAPDVYRELKAALAAIPPDSEYGTWFKVLQGLSRLSDTAQAYALALEWSTDSPKPGHTAAAFKDKWRSCMRENYSVNYTSVFYMADEHGREWRHTTPKDSVTTTLTPITLEELRDAQLHPRVILHHMLYADVRTRIAAGGVGKTTVAMFEAVSLALGRELWGRTPDVPVRTAFVTREDTREILVARMREIMRALNLGADAALQVISNVTILDLSGVSYRISEVVGDVVQPHKKNLDWLCETLEGFKPDWIIMDPMVSFGVGEQRVNDAEQGLIEAMRILKAKFNCCVEGIHHSGKANAREKTLDQYSGRGGSALSDGSRMVCVMQPLTAAEWAEVTGTHLNDGEYGLVMAMPKMSYCRGQDPVYIKRSGYLFEQVQIVAAPSVQETQRTHDDLVLGAIKEAWFKNQPLTAQGLKDEYKALFYGNLKRDAVMEALGRLKRDGLVLVGDTKGGRGQRSTLEPVIVERGAISKYAIPGENPAENPAE